MLRCSLGLIRKMTVVVTVTRIVIARHQVIIVIVDRLLAVTAIRGLRVLVNNQKTKEKEGGKIGHHHRLTRLDGKTFR